MSATTRPHGTIYLHRLQTPSANPQALAVVAGSWTSSFVSIADGSETFIIEELLHVLASEVGTLVQLVDTPPPQLPNLLAPLTPIPTTVDK